MSATTSTALSLSSSSTPVPSVSSSSLHLSEASSSESRSSTPELVKYFAPLFSQVGGFVVNPGIIQECVDRYPCIPKLSIEIKNVDKREALIPAAAVEKLRENKQLIVLVKHLSYVNSAKEFVRGPAIVAFATNTYYLSSTYYLPSDNKIVKRYGGGKAVCFNPNEGSCSTVSVMGRSDGTYHLQGSDTYEPFFESFFTLIGGGTLTQTNVRGVYLPYGGILTQVEEPCIWKSCLTLPAPPVEGVAASTNCQSLESHATEAEDIQKQIRALPICTAPILFPCTPEGMEAVRVAIQAVPFFSTFFPRELLPIVTSFLDFTLLGAKYSKER